MRLIRPVIHYLSHFKGHIVLVLACNLLYAFFSLFSLAAVVPFLSVLFDNQPVEMLKPDFALTAAALKQSYEYYMGQILLSSGKITALVWIGIGMVLFSFLSNLFRYLAFYCTASIRVGISRYMRQDVYYKITRLPLSFFSRHQKGDLLNRVGTDMQEIEWSIISTVQVLCRDPFLLLAYLVTLFGISLKLTLLSLAVLPLAGLLISYIGKRVQHEAIPAQSMLAKLSARFEETIGGLKIIKAYNAEKLSSENFKKENSTYTKMITNIFRINELGAPLIEFLCILSITVILFLGMRISSLGGNLPGEVFVFYILVFARVLPPTKQLVSAYYNFMKGQGAFSRVLDLLNSEEESHDTNLPDTVPAFKESIVFRHVSFSYQPQEDKKRVLKNINLVIRKGTTVAITGASGSGKSTLIDLLSRFHDPTEGNILIDGVDIQRYQREAIRKCFGVVSQDIVLFNDTVFNNIAFGEDMPVAKVREAATHAGADIFIAEMNEGYQTSVGECGSKLSGGQRQRISIARALLRDPDIIIMDEATSALDTETERGVQQSIQSLSKDKTLIIIAHRLSSIRHADSIIYLEDGQITEQGTHEELMQKKGGYFRLCKIQG
ncbi:MAG: ABC transporter ATP-binding protein/permease [Bacteroidales bacterium]|jgi:ABC-type multidrug transport system fused ATPase/permease subunit|nr:ABC transporter ATP-binding protein/permease [Bacteroidales bacterium]